MKCNLSWSSYIWNLLLKCYISVFLFLLLLKDSLKCLIKGTETENSSIIIISKEHVAPALTTAGVLLVFNLFTAASSFFLLFSVACFHISAAVIYSSAGQQSQQPAGGSWMSGCVCEKENLRREKSCLRTLESIGCDSLYVRSRRTGIEMMYCPLKRYGLELSLRCTGGLAVCKMEGCKCWAHPRVLYCIIDCLSKQHTNLSDTKCRLWGYVLLSGLAARKKQRAQCREYFSFYGFNLDSKDAPERNGNLELFKDSRLQKGREKPSRRSSAVNGLSVHHMTSVNFNKALLHLHRGATSFSSFLYSRLSTVQLRLCLWKGVHK